VAAPASARHAASLAQLRMLRISSVMEKHDAPKLRLNGTERVFFTSSTRAMAAISGR
jgi:hypothetical protein